MAGWHINTNGFSNEPVNYQKKETQVHAGVMLVKNIFIEIKAYLKEFF